MKAERRAATASPPSNIAAAAASALGAEDANDFRRRLEVVHAPDRRDPEARCAPDEFPLGDGIAILLPEDADDIACRAARDFEDYLAVSMNVMARVCRHGGAPAAGAVVASLDPSLRERECRIEVAADGVRLAGRDPRALAQAFYHLEDLMNLRGGPFLRHGVTTRRPRFAVRMTHSGYSDDLFPDEHLAQMAHHGMTAIIVFLTGVDQTTGQGHQDVNALIRRAARHGLDTYLYSCVEAFAHPDDGDAAFDESYGTIAGRYPEAKGIILVGESCQFPSKDPRVQPVAYRDKDANDPRPLAGWFPCADYPAWLEAVRRAIRKRAPGMEVVFWTYNVLGGSGTRGTLYAVHRFLEDDCGVRWWMDGDEDVPPAKPLAFGAFDRRRLRGAMMGRNFSRASWRMTIFGRLSRVSPCPFPTAAQ